MSARVLIADDDRAIRDALTRALGLEGYDVVQANDGNTALSVIESTQPDVAILDVMSAGFCAQSAIDCRS